MTPTSSAWRFICIGGFWYLLAVIAAGVLLELFSAYKRKAGK